MIFALKHDINAFFAVLFVEFGSLLFDYDNMNFMLLNENTISFKRNTIPILDLIDYNCHHMLNCVAVRSFSPIYSHILG